MAELKKKVTLKRKSEMPSEPMAQSKPSNKKWLIVVGLVAVFAVVGYFYLNPADIENPADGETSTVAIKTEVLAETKADSIISTDQPVAVKTNDAALATIEDSKEVTTNNNQPYKKGEIYNVYQFPFGVADYTQANPELDKLVAIMKQNPDFKISVSAFTDNVGDKNYNLALSKKRSKAIFNYLVSKGITSDRVTHSGKGISSKYSTASDNRRAEFTLI
jgi:outer membrane protein OmpA-like peptidoglycan-associated protein